MTPAQADWKDQYVKELSGLCGDRTLAEETFEAGLDFHDFEQDPKDAAREEYSCWDEDDGDAQPINGG